MGGRHQLHQRAERRRQNDTAPTHAPIMSSATTHLGFSGDMVILMLGSFDDTFSRLEYESTIASLRVVGQVTRTLPAFGGTSRRGHEAIRVQGRCSTRRPSRTPSDRAGLDRVTKHTLRHTRATHLPCRGVARLPGRQHSRPQRPDTAQQLCARTAERHADDLERVHEESARPSEHPREGKYRINQFILRNSKKSRRSVEVHSHCLSFANDGVGGSSPLAGPFSAGRSPKAAG